MDTDKRTKFEIPSFNLGLLNFKLEKLNRKAKKLGCQPITTKVLGMSKRKVETEDFKGTVTFYEIEVEGFAPKLSDWEFMGTLEHSEAGNVLRSVPGSELPETFRFAKQKCDHCNQVRNRKDTYVVKNNVTGEFKQVGHQCVRDFLGHTSPEHMAWLASLIRVMEESCSDHSHKAATVFTVMDFLSMAAECVIQFGFVSRSASNAYAEKSGGSGLTTTSSKAWMYLNPTPEMKKKGDLLVPSEAAFKLAGEALEWAKTLQVDGRFKSNYEANLFVICQKEILGDRDAGLLASLIAAYQKHLGVLELRKKKSDAMKEVAEKSNWFGQPGKREVFEVTVVGEHVFDGYQSFSETLYLYRMQDASGNVCIWKTANKRLEVGKSYKLKATVKEHATWKEIKQTVLQRCVEV